MRRGSPSDVLEQDLEPVPPRSGRSGRVHQLAATDDPRAPNLSVLFRASNLGSAIALISRPCSRTLRLMLA